MARIHLVAAALVLIALPAQAPGTSPFFSAPSNAEPSDTTSVFESSLQVTESPEEPEEETAPVPVCRTALQVTLTVWAGRVTDRRTDAYGLAIDGTLHPDVQLGALGSPLENGLKLEPPSPDMLAEAGLPLDQVTALLDGGLAVRLLVRSVFVDWTVLQARAIIDPAVGLGPAVDARLSQVLTGLPGSTVDPVTICGPLVAAEVPTLDTSGYDFISPVARQDGWSLDGVDVDVQLGPVQGSAGSSGADVILDDAVEPTVASAPTPLPVSSVPLDLPLL